MSSSPDLIYDYYYAKGIAGDHSSIERCMLIGLLFKLSKKRIT